MLLWHEFKGSQNSKACHLICSFIDVLLPYDKWQNVSCLLGLDYLTAGREVQKVVHLFNLAVETFSSSFTSFCLKYPCPTYCHPTSHPQTPPPPISTPLLTPNNQLIIYTRLEQTYFSQLWAVNMHLDVLYSSLLISQNQLADFYRGGPNRVRWKELWSDHLTYVDKLKVSGRDVKSLCLWKSFGQIISPTRTKLTVSWRGTGHFADERALVRSSHLHWQTEGGWKGCSYFACERALVIYTDKLKMSWRDTFTLPLRELWSDDLTYIDKQNSLCQIIAHTFLNWGWVEEVQVTLSVKEFCQTITPTLTNETALIK